MEPRLDTERERGLHGTKTRERPAWNQNSAGIPLAVSISILGIRKAAISSPSEIRFQRKSPYMVDCAISPDTLAGVSIFTTAAHPEWPQWHGGLVKSLLAKLRGREMFLHLDPGRQVLSLLGEGSKLTHWSHTKTSLAPWDPPHPPPPPPPPQKKILPFKVFDTQ